MVKTTTISFTTRGNADVRDVTDLVADALQRSGLKNGIVIVFCPSSTSGLTSIEYETGCVSDLRRLFDEIIAPDREYAHNARWDEGK